VEVGIIRVAEIVWLAEGTEGTEAPTGGEVDWSPGAESDEVVEVDDSSEAEIAEVDGGLDAEVLDLTTEEAPASAETVSNFDLLPLVDGEKEPNPRSWIPSPVNDGSTSLVGDSERFFKISISFCSTAFIFCLPTCTDPENFDVRVSTVAFSLAFSSRSCSSSADSFDFDFFFQLNQLLISHA